MIGKVAICSPKKTRRDPVRTSFQRARAHVFQQHAAIDRKDMEIYHLAHDTDEAFRIIQNTKTCPPNAAKCWYGYEARHVRDVPLK